MANRVTPLTNIETLSGSISAQTYFDNNIGPAFTALNDASLGYVNYQGTDTGSANNYVIATSFGTPSAYNAGMMVTFKPANTNTGASTITVNPLSSASIQRGDGTACIGGEIQAGKAITLEYNGTAFIIIGPPFLYGTTLYYDYDDFLVMPSGGTNPTNSKLLNLFHTGTGSITNTNFTTAHPGALTFTSGTSGVTAGAAWFLALDTFTITIRSILFTPAVIDTNQTMLCMISNTGSQLTSTQSSIALFCTSASGFWQMFTSNGSASTATPSTTAVAANTWYDLMIVATASSAAFFVNGTQIGTQSATYPSSSTLMVPEVGIVGLSGTSRSMAADTFEMMVTGIPVLSGSSLPRFLHGLV